MWGVRQTSDLVKQFDRMWDLRQNLLVFIAGLLVLVLLTFFVKVHLPVCVLIWFLAGKFSGSDHDFAARVLHEKTPEIQEPRIITFLADTSYAVYLFHWPFYIIFSQLMSNLPAVILTIIFSYFFRYPYPSILLSR